MSALGRFENFPSGSGKGVPGGEVAGVNMRKTLQMILRLVLNNGQARLAGAK